MLLFKRGMQPDKQRAYCTGSRILTYLSVLHYTTVFSTSHYGVCHVRRTCADRRRALCAIPVPVSVYDGGSDNIDLDSLTYHSRTSCVHSLTMHRSRHGTYLCSFRLATLEYVKLLLSCLETAMYLCGCRTWIPLDLNPPLLPRRDCCDAISSYPRTHRLPLAFWTA